MRNWFKNQRGAMFSMDARIALIVGSIVAGVIGVQVVQKVQRDRVEQGNLAAVQIIQALENYSAVTPNGPLPGQASTAAVDFADRVIGGGYGQNDIMLVDPWGSNWTWSYCTADVTIDGMSVNVYYAIVFSPGPDGIPYSYTNLLQQSGCQNRFSAWAPMEDDIGIKFTNFEQQRARIAEYKRRAQSVIGALQAYEQKSLALNVEFCGGLSEAGRAGNTRCNWDTSTNSTGYEAGEETFMNYFPRSTLDRSATSSTCSANNFYYYNNHTAGSVLWNYNTATGLNMLRAIGLTDEYATDPWGRNLCYNSNVNCSCRAPFAISVKYVSSASECPQVC